VAVESDVVDRGPAGVVVLEQILNAAVAQPLGFEAVEAGTPPTSFAATRRLVAEAQVEEVPCQVRPLTSPDIITISIIATILSLTWWSLIYI